MIIEWLWISAGLNRPSCNLISLSSGNEIEWLMLRTLNLVDAVTSYGSQWRSTNTLHAHCFSCVSFLYLSSLYLKALR